VVAIDDASGNVVGVITAITDGVLAAFIPMLEVVPEFQHQGIGRQLVQRVVERLDPIYSIDLSCDPDMQLFYRGLGFQDATGMAIRNYANQSGGAPTPEAQQRQRPAGLSRRALIMWSALDA
jgi:ribosomal protein S18 acetylase RimI-like enzyme